LVRHLADALTNDLYYFDLRAIGEQLAATLRQPTIREALVFDRGGRVVHDGSQDISTYGSSPNPELLVRALANDGVQVVVRDGESSAAPRMRSGEEVLGAVLLRFCLASMGEAATSDNPSLGRSLERASRFRIGSLVFLLVLGGLLGVLSGWVIQRWIVGAI